MKMLKREKKKGIALIMALWIMVALLVICSSFVYMMRIELRIAKDYTHGVQAHYLARAGIARALGELNADNVDAPPNYIKTDSLHENWFTTFSENFGYTTADYDEMVWDETWFPLGEGGYQVRLLDESGMHNINAMEGGILHPTSTVGMDDLFGETVAGEHKACRIRDYRDDDIIAMSNTGSGTGWDSPDCKNKPYDTIREIQKVKDINVDMSGDGIDDNPLALYTNELTVHSQDYDTDLDGAARLNLNLATQAEIAFVLNNPGEDADPTEAALSIWNGIPWSTVGCIDVELTGTTDERSITMKKVADKFTVAPPVAGAIYYKPDTLPNVILGPININTAPKKSLCSLIYIGPTCAKYIIETRHYYGGREPSAARKEDAVGSPTFTYGVANSGEYGRGELVLTYWIGSLTFDHMSDQVTVRSDRFRIVSTGRVGTDGNGDGKIDPGTAADTVLAQRKIEVVVDRHYHDQNPTASGIDTGVFHTMGPFEILYWSETVPELF